MRKVIGLIGTYLAGKTSIVSILGTDMTLSEKINFYLPSLRKKIDNVLQSIRQNPNMSAINNLKCELEGLLKRDLHYITRYEEELRKRDIPKGKMRRTQILQYTFVLNVLKVEIEYEMIALSGAGSPTEEIRCLGNLKVKIYPGQALEMGPNHRDVIEFVKECDGRIAWTLSPKDLYAIISFVKTGNKNNLVNAIKIVEDKIKRKRTYFLITKVDNVKKISGCIKLTENIEDFRKGISIKIPEVIDVEYLKNILERFYGKIDKRLAEKVISKVLKVLDIHEMVYRTIEMYALYWFSKYYLNKDVGNILYTSAEERRNVEECLKFLKNIEGGTVRDVF